MKVIKVGGGCLKGKENIAQILDLLGERGLGHVVVVSALSGVTDQLYDGIALALEHESNIPTLMSSLRSKHQLVARHLIACANSIKNFNRKLFKRLKLFRFKVFKLYLPAFSLNRFNLKYCIILKGM